MSKNTMKTVYLTALVTLVIFATAILFVMSCGGGGGGGASGGGGGTQNPDRSAEYVSQMVALNSKLENNLISETDFLTQFRDLLVNIDNTPNAVQQLQTYLANIEKESTISLTAIMDDHYVNNADGMKETPQDVIDDFVKNIALKTLDNFLADCEKNFRNFNDLLKNTVVAIRNDIAETKVAIDCNFSVESRCIEAREKLRNKDYPGAVAAAYQGTGKTVTWQYTIALSAPPPSMNNVSLAATPGCENNGTSTIWLAWTALSGATSYNIYRNGNLLANGIVLRNFTDDKITAGGSYSYYVVAKGLALEYNSNTKNVVAKTCGTPAPLPTSTTTSTTVNPTTTTTSISPTTSVGPTTSVRPTTSVSTTTSVAPTPNPYRGSLSGGWSGICPSFGGASVSGSFTLNIDANGVATGSYSGSQSGSINGTVNSGGTFYAGGGSGSGGVTWSGNFSLNGTILRGSGGWSDPDCSGAWSGP